MQAPSIQLDVQAEEDRMLRTEENQILNIARDRTTAFVGGRAPLSGVGRWREHQTDYSANQTNGKSHQCTSGTSRLYRFAICCSKKNRGDF
jgi:hypothetical protein